MSVSNMGTQGSPGKKTLDAELNLIPFIDLLICCICFLLITAVWTQMAHIGVTQRSPGVATGEQAKALKVSVLVGDEGYALYSSAGERLVIAKRGLAYDTAALGRKLRVLRGRISGSPTLTVAVEDGIHYRHLIRALDVARKAHFTSIDVSDAGAML